MNRCVNVLECLKNQLKVFTSIHIEIRNYERLVARNSKLNFSGVSYIFWYQRHDTRERILFYSQWIRLAEIFSCRLEKHFLAFLKLCPWNLISQHFVLFVVNLMLINSLILQLQNALWINNRHHAELSMRLIKKASESVKIWIISSVLMRMDFSEVRISTDNRSKDIQMHSESINFLIN